MSNTFPFYYITFKKISLLERTNFFNKNKLELALANLERSDLRVFVELFLKKFVELVRGAKRQSSERSEALKKVRYS